MTIPMKPVDGVQTPSAQPSVDYYQVKGKNETLESISKQTGFPVKDIQERNKHIKSDKQVLTPGQEIELPPPKPKATTKKTEPGLEAQIANSKVGQQGKTGLDQTATVGRTWTVAD